MERKPDPEPLETNDVALVAGGTALWAVALVVVLVLKVAGTDVRTWWWQLCASGVVLGLIGTRYCWRRRARLRSAGPQ